MTWAIAMSKEIRDVQAQVLDHVRRRTEVDWEKTKFVWMPDEHCWAISYAFTIRMSDEEAVAFQNQLDAPHQETTPA